MNAALAVLLSTASTAAITGERVAIGVTSWTGAKAIAHLIATVVTERIGGEVEMVLGNNANIFQAMDQGKGDIDVHPNVWLPNQESFTNKYVVGAGTVLLSENHYIGNQGFCVTRSFAEEKNITDGLLQPLVQCSTS